jgi:hypothetical protein
MSHERSPDGPEDPDAQERARKPTLLKQAAAKIQQGVASVTIENATPGALTPIDGLVLLYHAIRNIGRTGGDTPQDEHL